MRARRILRIRTCPDAAAVDPDRSAPGSSIGKAGAGRLRRGWRRHGGPRGTGRRGPGLGASLPAGRRWHDPVAGLRLRLPYRSVLPRGLPPGVQGLVPLAVDAYRSRSASCCGRPSAGPHPAGCAAGRRVHAVADPASGDDEADRPWPRLRHPVQPDGLPALRACDQPPAPAVRPPSGGASIRRIAASPPISDPRARRPAMPLDPASPGLPGPVALRRPYAGRPDLRHPHRPRPAPP